MLILGDIKFRRRQDEIGPLIHYGDDASHEGSDILVILHALARDRKLSIIGMQIERKLDCSVGIAR
jgi:hypothetical protein